MTSSIQRSAHGGRSNSERRSTPGWRWRRPRRGPGSVARLNGEAWKQRAIDALIELLLDPDDTRIRCIVLYADRPLPALRRGQVRPPQPRRVDEVAIDRAELRPALQTLTNGEIRAVCLRYAKCRMTPTERVLLSRALMKTGEVRKRFGPQPGQKDEGVLGLPSIFKRERAEAGDTE